MSKIHNGQSISANWKAAVEDGKVTNKETRQIVAAAKAAGVMRAELDEAFMISFDAKHTALDTWRQGPQSTEAYPGT
ncbi:MAG: hypothetical protein ABIJ09_21925 [Pseudomonadota bacterium]